MQESKTYKYPPNLNLPLVRGGTYVTNLGKTVEVTYISNYGKAEVCLNGNYYMTACECTGADIYGQYERIAEGPINVPR